MITDEKASKVYDFIKGNLINLIVIITAFAYLFYGMVSISTEEFSIQEGVAKGVIGIIVGLIIKQSLGENGFNRGYRSQIWITNLEKYQKACNLANPYIEKVDNFYAYEEMEKKREYRRQNMMSAQMKYVWFFDKVGNYVKNPEQYQKLTRYQKKILKKCVKVKIYNLNLFSEYGNEIKNYTHREKTDKEQRAKMFTKNGLVAIVTSAVGVYFVASWDGWNWAEFILTAIQIAIWIATGITQLYTNYNYVAVEKVNKMTRKIEGIIKFTKGCESGKYDTNPYEEQEEQELQESQEEEKINGQEIVFD